MAEPHRNVVLVCLDSVRKDYFDRYADRIRELADVSFAQCRAASSWSTPSHASMFTGKLPHQHRVHTHDRHFDGISPDDTFLGRLEDHTTIGISANEFAGPAFGFDGLFDEFDALSPVHRYPDGLNVHRFVQEEDVTVFTRYPKALLAMFRHNSPWASIKNGLTAQLHELMRTGPLPKVVDDGATAVLRTTRQRVAQTDGPHVTFVNLMDAHGPLQHVVGFDRSIHDAPNSWTSAQRGVWELMDRSADHETYWDVRQGVYAAAIDYLDRKVAEFVRELPGTDGEETTVVVTADHGENLGGPADEYKANHKSSLSEGLLHVPLAVINAPTWLSDDGGYISHLNLGDLLVALARDDRVDAERDGVPAELVGMSAGPDPPETFDYSQWDRMIRCTYEGSSKVVWDSTGDETLYELHPERPCWQRRVDGEPTVPDWASDWFDEPIREYKDRARSTATRTSVTDATADRLRELGYL